MCFHHDTGADASNCTTEETPPVGPGRKNRHGDAEGRTHPRSTSAGQGPAPRPHRMRQRHSRSQAGPTQPGTRPGAADATSPASASSLILLTWGCRELGRARASVRGRLACSFRGFDSRTPRRVSPPETRMFTSETCHIELCCSGRGDIIFGCVHMLSFKGPHIL